MRHDKGFTLVELLVVIVIFAIMSSVAVPGYSRWKAKHDVESQISEIYGDLEFARMKAYSEKKPFELWWNASPFTSYAIRCDGNGDGDYVDAVDTNIVKNTRYQVTRAASDNPNSIRFSGRGFCSTGTLRIASNTGASSDCVLISQTRIIPGKWNGASCVPK